MSESGPDLEKYAVDSVQKSRFQRIKEKFKKARSVVAFAGRMALGGLRIAAGPGDELAGAVVQAVAPHPSEQSAVLPYQVKVTDNQREVQKNKAAGNAPPPPDSQLRT